MTTTFTNKINIELINVYNYSNRVYTCQTIIKMLYKAKPTIYFTFMTINMHINTGYALLVSLPFPSKFTS